MVTPCPAPNAQSLSHVSMSEKTSGGYVGQCLGTSAVAMQGPAICSAASFHQAALAEPPEPLQHYCPSLHLLWCCGSCALHLQRLVVLLWQAWTPLLHLCVCESTSISCVTQLLGCKKSMQSLKTCRHFHEGDFVVMQFLSSCPSPCPLPTKKTKPNQKAPP